MQSLINIETLRAQHRSKLAEVSLDSKIIYRLRVEHPMRTTFGEAWGCLDHERQGTWGRLYQLLKARLDALVITQWAWSPARIQEGLHIRMERPRKRKLQCLPSRVVGLQHSPAALSEAA